MNDSIEFELIIESKIKLKDNIIIYINKYICGLYKYFFKIYLFHPIPLVFMVKAWLLLF